MRSTIIREALPDNLWLEVLLPMIYISNLLFTSSLDRLSSYEASTGSFLQLSYLKVLRSMIYIFIYKEGKKAKSAKWEPRAKRGLFIGYDDHFIYQIYLEKDAKVIILKI